MIHSGDMYHYGTQYEDDLSQGWSSNAYGAKLKSVDENYLYIYAPNYDMTLYYNYYDTDQLIHTSLLVNESGYSYLFISK